MIRIDKHKFGPWAIVTGASSGIGEAFAEHLAANGLNLILVARRQPLLEALGGRLARKYGTQYRAVGLDLSDENFLDTIQAATHQLDMGLLISNAGAIAYGNFLTSERAALQRNLHLNLTAHLHLIHHYGQGMAKRGHGGVLMVSSLAGLQGTPYMADYSAAKAYLLSLGEALHIEFELLGLNLTVLVPGPTETPMLANSGTDRADLPMKPMSASQTAAEGLAALNANRPIYIPGRMNRIMIALMPRSIRPKMMGAMVAKGLARLKAQAAHSAQ
jgi:uncharacterized protein